MSEQPWRAPMASGPVDATVAVPGSKSLANRALVLAALSDGPSTISSLPLRARDITLMITALESLGCVVEATDPGGSGSPLRVTPGPVRTPAQVDCGLAGTVMRFVPPVAALGTGPVGFDGDERARARPMASMIRALRVLGIDIDDGGRGALPFTVHGSGEVAGGPVAIDASATSQFVTALLLSGARFRDGVEVRHRGGPFPSLPHIDMTCRMLAEHGVSVTSDTAERTRARWSVAPGPIRAVDRAIEPDLSNALPLAAAAVVTGGRVLIRHWPEDSLQPGGHVLELLRQMGAETRFTASGLQVTGTGVVQGLDADLRDVGELVPTVAALCALADGPSHLRGIGHIAGHETDRLAALAAEINGLGGDATASADGLTIRPRALHGGTWHVYADHRMATAGAIIGLRVADVVVDEIGATGKTFAEFPDVWRDLVATTRPQPAGAG